MTAGVRVVEGGERAFRTDPHEPAPARSAESVDRFADTIEQVRLARELGFDLITFGQHFLLNEFQAIQPAIAAARLAAETGTMRVGITIYLLPLLNPVAVAEEAASLDVVTGGRFIFGIGLGYREAEDNAFGLRAGRACHEAPRPPGRHQEALDRRAGRLREQRTAGSRAPRWRLRPVQQPHPPIWVAANNDRAVERAAEIGDTWVINPHATLATIVRQMGLYRAALAAAGQAVPGRAADDARDLRRREPRGGAASLPGRAWSRSTGRTSPGASSARCPSDDDMTQAFDDLLRDRFIMGDSGRVRRRDPALRRRDRRQHDDLPRDLAGHAPGRDLAQPAPARRAGAPAHLGGKLLTRQLPGSAIRWWHSVVRGGPAWSSGGHTWFFGGHKWSFGGHRWVPDHGATRSAIGFVSSKTWVMVLIAGGMRGSIRRSGRDYP